MEKIEHTESSAVAKVSQELEKLEVNKSVGILSAFEFLVGYFKESEANNFSVVKANVHLGKLSEKLIDLKETGNDMAEKFLKNLKDPTVKTSGLTTAARMTMGEGASELQEITIYAFAPCTSASVEISFRSYIHFCRTEQNKQN